MSVRKTVSVLCLSRTEAAFFRPFSGDVDGADVTVALLQYQYRLQVVFTGFQKRHNHFLLIIQMDYHYQVLINCNIEIRLTQPIAVKWGIRRNRVRCPGMVV